MRRQRNEWLTLFCEYAVAALAEATVAALGWTIRKVRKWWRRRRRDAA